MGTSEAAKQPVESLKKLKVSKRQLQNKMATAKCQRSRRCSTEFN